MLSRRGLITGAAALAAYSQMEDAEAVNRLLLLGGKVSPYLGQVATRSFLPNSISTPNKQAMSRSGHYARDNITSLKIALANFYCASVETGLGSTTTWTASVEYPAGTFTRILFSGASSAVAASASVLFSDMVSVTIPKNAMFWIRTYQSSTAGIYFNQGAAGNSVTFGDSFTFGVSGIADQTMGGTVVSTAGTQYEFFPSGIASMTSQPSVAALGDSRTYGFGDTSDATGDIGEICRSVGSTYAYINIGSNSDRCAYFNASHAGRIQLASLCTSVVDAYGINDIDNGLSSAGLIALKQSNRSLFPTQKFFNVTVPPHSNAGNTGPLSPVSDAQRIAFNTAVRAGISGATGYFEIADVDETARNSSIWNTGYTADELHENQTAALAIKSSGNINVSVFHR